MPLHISIAIIIFLIVGCSSPVKDYSDKIYVRSVSHKFIDEMLQTNHERKADTEIPVWVGLPNSSKFQAPYPAVILLHSSWGLSSQESFYANELNNMGIATYVIDSFTPRGVAKTSVDQSLVSGASMIQDAYQVLDYLQGVPEIIEERVAVMGFSKGGIVAFYSAFDEIKRAVNINSNASFAAHIAYYPWCGIRLKNMQVTGAPILIQGGSKDIITPVDKCSQLVREEFSESDQASVLVKTHIGARHAFDHPTLSKVPFPLSLDAQVPALCDIRQNDQSEFIEVYKNVVVNSDNVKSVLENCSTFNGMASYNRKAAQSALEIFKEFITQHLLN